MKVVRAFAVVFGLFLLLVIVNEFSINGRTRLWDKSSLLSSRLSSAVRFKTTIQELVAELRKLTGVQLDRARELEDTGDFVIFSGLEEPICVNFCFSKVQGEIKVYVDSKTMRTTAFELRWVPLGVP